jgi:hypothetical protein
MADSQERITLKFADPGLDHFDFPGKVRSSVYYTFQLELRHWRTDRTYNYGG